jgi:hypothetical protein
MRNVKRGNYFDRTDICFTPGESKLLLINSRKSAYEMEEPYLHRHKAEDIPDKGRSLQNEYLSKSKQVNILTTRTGRVLAEQYQYLSHLLHSFWIYGEGTTPCVQPFGETSNKFQRW